MKNRCLIWIFAGYILLLMSACQGFLAPLPDAEEVRLRTAIRIHPAHEAGYVRLAQYLENRRRYSETFAVLRVGRQHLPDSVVLLRLEGGLYQDLGYSEDALQFYSEQLQKHPDTAWLLLDRAQLYWQMKQDASALKDAKKALNINPDLFEAHYLLGVILGREPEPPPRTVADAPKKTEAALNALIAASRLNDQNPDVWWRISVLWEKRGQTAPALQAMLRAVELSPESERFLRRYAILLEKELDLVNPKNSATIAEALRQTLRQMLKLFPEKPDLRRWTHAHYGNWAWTQGKYSLAETHLKRALELQPSYSWAAFRLGMVYLSQKKWQKGLQLFENGLRDEPKNTWAIQQLAFALEMLEQNEKALARYEWLRQNTEPNLAVIERLSDLYRKEFRFEEGEKTLLRGLELFPQEPQLTKKLVAYYEQRGLFEKAQKVLSAFVQTEPNNISVLAKLGFYEMNLKRPEKALFWFEKALKIAPDFDWARMQQINILLSGNPGDKSERAETAEKLLQGFLEGKPDSEWATLKLARLKLEQKQYPEVENLLENGLAQHPQSITLLKTQGRLFEILERWREAQQIFQKLIKMRSDNVRPASLFLTHLAFTQWKSGQTEKANLNVTQALYENPGNIWAWYLHLLLLPKTEQRRRFGEDWPLLRPVVATLSSQTPEVAWEKITTLRTDPFTRQVLKNLYFLFEDAPQEIKMEPQDLTSKQLPPWLKNQWGYFHQILGKHQFAAQHYETVLKALPENSWIHARLGWIYERLEQAEKSKQHYNLFLQKHPQSFDVMFRLANVLTILGDEKAMLKLYEKMLAARPNHDLALNNLAWLYLTAKDHSLRNLSKAMKLAQKSVDLQPTIDNLDTLAEAYFQSGDTEKAIEILRKAARDMEFPPSRHPYLRKQFLRFRKGDRKAETPTLS